MQTETINNLIKKELHDAKVEVNGDGYHFQIKVISSSFAGLNKVKRQQLVYKALHAAITSGDLHAISINAYTPDEIS